MVQGSGNGFGLIVEDWVVEGLGFTAAQSYPEPAHQWRIFGVTWLSKREVILATGIRLGKS